jgi:hypothetical protein
MAEWKKVQSTSCLSIMKERAMWDDFISVDSRNKLN